MRELGYERVSGSAQERAVAQRLLEEVQGAAAAHLEEFSVPCGRVKHARLKVTEPYEKEYEVTGYQRARSTPAEGLDGSILLARKMCCPRTSQQAAGKIVLINGRLRRKDYEALQKAGVAAILTFSGSTWTAAAKRTATSASCGKPTEPFGDAVALNLRAADAAEWCAGARKRCTWSWRASYDGVSQNVCAEIPGTDRPQEIISGAHYDSVYFPPACTITCPAALSSWSCCGTSPRIRPAGR